MPYSCAALLSYFAHRDMLLYVDVFDDADSMLDIMLEERFGA